MTHPIVVVMIFVAAACTSNPEAANTAEGAKKVADAYMRDRGDSNPRSPVTIMEEGQMWEVTYHAPPGLAGGANTVWVDKRTMTVVDFVGTQ